jgi:hypothetical protein
LLGVAGDPRSFEFSTTGCVEGKCCSAIFCLRCQQLYSAFGVTRSGEHWHRQKRVAIKRQGSCIASPALAAGRKVDLRVLFSDIERAAESVFKYRTAPWIIFGVAPSIALLSSDSFTRHFSTFAGTWEVPLCQALWGKGRSRLRS